MLLFCWLLPLFVENDTLTFEVNNTNYSQVITNSIDYVFISRDILLTNVLLIDNFMKRYRTAFVVNLITNKKINHSELIDNDNQTIL